MLQELPLQGGTVGSVRGLPVRHREGTRVRGGDGKPGGRRPRGQLVASGGEGWVVPDYDHRREGLFRQKKKPKLTGKETPLKKKRKKLKFMAGRVQGRMIQSRGAGHVLFCRKIATRKRRDDRTHSTAWTK